MSSVYCKQPPKECFGAVQCIFLLNALKALIYHSKQHPNALLTNVQSSAVL